MNIPTFAKNVKPGTTKPNTDTAVEVMCVKNGIKKTTAEPIVAISERSPTDSPYTLMCIKLIIVTRAMPHISTIILAFSTSLCCTKFDVQGAKSLGIDCIGVTYGFGTAAELKGCVAVANSVAELEKILG